MYVRANPAVCLPREPRAVSALSLVAATSPSGFRAVVCSFIPFIGSVWVCRLYTDTHNLPHIACLETAFSAADQARSRYLQFRTASIKGCNTEKLVEIDKPHRSGCVELNPPICPYLSLLSLQ